MPKNRTEVMLMIVVNWSPSEKITEQEVLEGKRGEGYIDTAVKMIIAVVIGALLLGGLYFIFNDMILPGLAERIQDMFGSPGAGGNNGGGGGIIFL